MGLYQIELTTDMDIVSVVVNAYDENEAISIALTMFERGEIDSAGSVIVNAAAFPAC
jgi:hypothetical protein